MAKKPTVAVTERPLTQDFDLPGHPGERVTVYRQLAGRAYTLINQEWSRPRFVGWKDSGQPEFEPTINAIAGYWEALIQGCTDRESSWNLRNKNRQLMQRTRDAINEDRVHAEAFNAIAPAIYEFVMQSDASAEGNAKGTGEPPDAGTSSTNSSDQPSLED